MEIEGKKIKIGNKTWTVKLTDKMNDNPDSLCYGVTRYVEQEIWISQSAKKDHRLETLLHELLHVFFMPISGSKDEQIDNKIDIELACNLFGDGMAPIYNSRQLADIVDMLEND
jgi:Zn-dependent peptidase ImmA (M78 family)